MLERRDERPARAEGGASAAGRGAILLIDDDPGIREMVTAALTADGYHVAGCGDDLEMQLWMDLSSCRARDDDKIAAVQMVNQRSIEKLNPMIRPSSVSVAARIVAKSSRMSSSILP